MGKLLGLDFGLKRVGYAVSDESHTIVFPRGILQKNPKERFFKEIAKIIKDEGIEKIIIGIPLDEDNNETHISASARKLGEELRSAFGLAIAYTDEFNTTSEAIAKIPFKKDRAAKKGWRDAVAAQLILERYLGVPLLGRE